MVLYISSGMQTEIIICDRCGETCDSDEAIEYTTMSGRRSNQTLKAPRYIHLCLNYCFAEFADFLSGETL